MKTSCNENHNCEKESQTKPQLELIKTAFMACIAAEFGTPRNAYEERIWSGTSEAFDQLVQTVREHLKESRAPFRHPEEGE